MSFLHSVVSFQMGYLIAAVVVGASFLVLWISTLLSRRWYVTIRKSEETELLVVCLSRIADSLDRLAGTRESPMLQRSSDSSERKPVGISMFGL
jgi:hypothetical protein